ncbi:transposase [Modestobacter marinus]|uniref:transposase n=1 Tax=Modestobacter marinus TaxID=477641 RepID=UPI0021BBB823|nr:transposase [Modestobacter marinus]
MDEFGPRNLQPHPGRQWASTAVGTGDPERPRRRRRRATYLRPHGIRHLLACYDLAADRLHGHIRVRKTRTGFLAFCRYLRTLHPAGVRIAIVLDSLSPHRSTKTDRRVGEWAAANNVELAYVPFYGSWLNRIEAQFTALRYFALDGTDHPSHRERGSMIRRYIAWRNRHVTDSTRRKIVRRAETIKRRRLPDPAPAAGLRRCAAPSERRRRSRTPCTRRRRARAGRPAADAAAGPTSHRRPGP